jgi:hypothetical protein
VDSPNTAYCFKMLGLLSLNTTPFGLAAYALGYGGKEGLGNRSTLLAGKTFDAGQKPATGLLADGSPQVSAVAKPGAWL